MTDIADTEELTDDQVDPELIEATAVIGAASQPERLAGDLELIVERAMDHPGPLLDRMKLLARSLGAYLGDETTAATYVILAIAGVDLGDQSLFSGVEDDEARQNLEATFRRLRGLYSDEVDRGLQLATRPAEDWQYIDVTTRLDLEDGRWEIDVDLQRFDGEGARVVGDPLSILRLVNHLLGAINDVGEITEDYLAILNDMDDTELFDKLATRIFDGLAASLVAAADDNG
ncbi:MAG: hypothetical protein BMS9Abin07_2255 [Acidimicrobiia bacterium]|nr:MAG: hypothetical protein BMS9Abin07_2255 [Acidimicrobiia bacterium]